MANRVSLTTTVRRYINEPDEDNSHFEDDEIYDYLNQAIRFLGAEMEWPFQTAQATSVENQAVYTLPEDFISLVDLYFDGRDIPIVERADLSAARNDWQNADAGTPRFGYKSDNAKIGLWPKPDANSADLLIQIQYIKLPPDLDDDTTAPDLHVAFQDCLPFYAAFLCEHKMGNTKRAEFNLTLYESHKKKLMSRLQRFSDDALRFRWSEPRMYQ